MARWDVFGFFEFRVRAVCARVWREDAAVAGLAVHVIVHFGFVEIGVAENFFHQRNAFGQLGFHDARALFPVGERFGHAALIRIDQREDVLIAELIGGTGVLRVFGFGEFGDAVAELGDGLGVELADRGGGAIPAGGFFHGEKGGLDGGGRRR